MKESKKLHSVSAIWALCLLSLGLAGSAFSDDNHGHHHQRNKAAKTLYIWAGDQARVAPDFLAVIDFDEDSPDCGKVIRTVPVPPPGNVGNEPHHCHLSADKKILACGGGV
jgi:selenium-binding protein 1